MAVSLRREPAAPFNRHTGSLSLLEQRRKTWVTCSNKLRSMIKRRPADPSSCHTAAYLLALVEDKDFESSLSQGSCCGESRHTRTNHEHVCVSMDGVLHLR